MRDQLRPPAREIMLVPRRLAEEDGDFDGAPQARRRWRWAGAPGCALGPERRCASRIRGTSPDLCRLAICGVDDMDQVELELLAGPFGADRGERDRVVVADQDIVQLGLNGATGQLRDLA